MLNFHALYKSGLKKINTFPTVDVITKMFENNSFITEPQRAYTVHSGTQNPSAANEHELVGPRISSQLCNVMVGNGGISLKPCYRTYH
jgi:hypothetical protein